MAILDKFTQEGSLLTNLDGQTPKSYDGKSKYELNLQESQLDLDGKTPETYDDVSAYEQDLQISQLDLDGKTPKKYLDNLPR